MKRFMPLLWYFITIKLLLLLNHVLCNESVSENESNNVYLNESVCGHLNEVKKENRMIWSEFLEDYVLSERQSKDMSYDVMGPQSNQQKFTIMINSDVQQQQQQQQQLQQQLQQQQQHQIPFNYHSSNFKRPSAFINKRIGEIGVELEPHKRPPPVQPQFRPMLQQQPGLLQQLFGIGVGSNQQQNPSPMRPSMTIPPHNNNNNHMHHSNHQQQPVRTITENDLYLLGAIEKLVYRVDYLESRVRRTEQLIYYLMAGNNQKDVRDPCPANFTRVNDNCYYFNSYQQVNWKTANSACKALNSHLVEFERNAENEEIIAYLLNQPSYRGRDYWLGALNPGLLWIWSNSAKPVNPNTNLTSIAMGQSINELNETNTIHNSVLNNNNNENEIDKGKDRDKDKENEISGISNYVAEIRGNGRCLRLTYNSSKHSYGYYGQECTSRHHFICEYEDKTLANKIKKLTRELKL